MADEHSMDDQRNILVKTDIKLSHFIAICSEPSVVYGRGKQLMRCIARGTQPTVVVVWIFLWIIATRDAALHENLVNMFVGSLVGWLLCSILKLIFKRPRPMLTGGNRGQGVNQYSLPNDHIMIITLAYCIVTSAYKGNPDVMKLMKTVLVVIKFTKLMLGRTYIFDVMAGVVLGLLVNQFLVRFLWISSARSEPYIKSVQATLHLYQ